MLENFPDNSLSQLSPEAQFSARNTTNNLKELQRSADPLAAMGPLYCKGGFVLRKGKLGMRREGEKKDGENGKGNERRIEFRHFLFYNKSTVGYL